MKELLDALIAAIDRGESAVLCSIVHTDGSSPRGAGARMAVFADGSTGGTIGGGEAECLAASFARSLFGTQKTVLRRYELYPNGKADIGMICGGEVSVLFQPFSSRDANEVSVLRAWREKLDGTEDAWLFMNFDGTELRGFSVKSGSELSTPQLRSLFAHGEWENGAYLEQVFRAGKVYLFGGGHVGRALIPVLAEVGFPVVLLDDREALARAENYPRAERVILADFASIDRFVSITARDYAVVMTPGHHSDYQILSQLLRTEASYIGCIGSKKKVEATREKLLADGVSTRDIDRVHSPIGLDIGAETPQEIAVSIAAEMIAHRAQHR